MKTLTFLCVTGLVATAAPAQWTGTPIPTVPMLNIDSGYAFSPGGTPTMVRQKLRESIALRAEAHQLEAQDGGRLSPHHVAYIRKRVREIRGAAVASPQTGTLVRPN